LHSQLEEALAARGQTVEDAIRAEGQHQAAEQAGMANLIGSLRLISTFDWSEFFESVSLVEQVLQRDPACVYGLMDFRSRDRYRHAIEELAMPTGEGQLLLALKSVERARQLLADSTVRRPATMIGAGRQFERSIAWQPAPGACGGSFSRGRPRNLSPVAGTALVSTPSSAWWHGWRGARWFSLRLHGMPRQRWCQLPADDRLGPPAASSSNLKRALVGRTMVIMPTLLVSVDRVGDHLHLEVQAINIDS
jgi:cyclic beta-1,2-glucan synthetase